MAKKYDIKPEVANIRIKRNVVKVRVPVKDYYNLESMQEIQKDILGELGCMACCSGWDIRFYIQRDFIIKR